LTLGANSPPHITSEDSNAITAVIVNAESPRRVVATGAFRVLSATPKRRQHNDYRAATIEQRLEQVEQQNQRIERTNKRDF